MNMSPSNARLSVLKLSLQYMTILLTILVVGITTWLPAQAQQSIPPGSYKQSCYNVSVSGNTLSARCGAMNGNWVFTSLQNFAMCEGDISNWDGNLTCKMPNLPEGSYRLSCNQISVNATTLYALCKTRTGNWYNTSLGNWKECNGDISNQNGTLTCPKGPLIRFDSSSYVLTGSGFSANTAIYIRVVSLSGLGSYPQVFSDSSGYISAKLNFTCTRGYKVGISANDNRWDSSRNDYLWSNVVEFWCP